MKTWKLAVLAFALLVTSAGSQEKKIDPKAPVISQELLAKYFKSQLALEQTQARLKTITQDLQQIIAQINTACGDKFQAQIGPDGDPACQPKPEPKAK